MSKGLDQIFADPATGPTEILNVLYLTTVSGQMLPNPHNPEAATITTAARGLRDYLPAFFTADRKPANMNEEETGEKAGSDFHGKRREEDAGGRSFDVGPDELNQLVEDRTELSDIAHASLGHAGRAAAASAIGREAAPAAFNQRQFRHRPRRPSVPRVDPEAPPGRRLSIVP